MAENDCDLLNEFFSGTSASVEVFFCYLLVFVYHSKQILKGVVGCVWVYRQEVELRWRWEYGDEKTRIN